ncbi:unnamed protein product [Staurois parvus]|uniref:Uncharacterized protein n=1 Tax=Staurois parvus TaxID=386267 RepID=A0ABN9FMB7_9NEOB|nr:unnamed protein product [Staurois parvus]
MVGMDLEPPPRPGCGYWVRPSVVVVCAKGSHGKETDMRRSEDPTARDGWMDEQGQTGRVGNREDGKVQDSGQRMVGSHARSATAGQIQ